MQERIQLEIELVKERFPEVEYQPEAAGYGSGRTHCLKGGTEKQLTSFSKSAMAILELSLTASTLPQGYSLTTPLRAVARTQPLTSPHSRAPGGSFLGLLKAVGFLHPTFVRAPTCWIGSEDSKTVLRKGPRMAKAHLYMSKEVVKAVWKHLLEDEPKMEAAGFIFSKHLPKGEAHEFQTLEWYPIPPEGYLFRNSYHFVLTDQIRAEVIKRAHDLSASLVEFHCHRGHWPARFSPSDQAGFQEFVPHVRWRLKGRPYLAVVVTERDFDALAWIKGSGTPQHLAGIVADGSTMEPTRLSPLRPDCDEQQAF